MYSRDKQNVLRNLQNCKTKKIQIKKQTKKQKTMIIHLKCTEQKATFLICGLNYEGYSFFLVSAFLFSVSCHHLGCFSILNRIIKCHSDQTFLLKRQIFLRYWIIEFDVFLDFFILQVSRFFDWPEKTEGNWNKHAKNYEQLLGVNDCVRYSKEVVHFGNLFKYGLKLKIWLSRERFIRKSWI